MGMLELAKLAKAAAEVPFDHLVGFKVARGRPVAVPKLVAFTWVLVGGIAAAIAMATMPRIETSEARILFE
jgi:hypothetical protein